MRNLLTTLLHFFFRRKWVIRFMHVPIEFKLSCSGCRQADCDREMKREKKRRKN